MTRPTLFTLFAACTALIVCAACDDMDPHPHPDPSATSQTSTSGTTSTPDDVGVDSGSDTGDDVGTDAEPDAVDEDTGPDPNDLLRPGVVTFPQTGSISQPSGLGSFTFGAATAATQIEDQNTRTDWWYWTLPAPDGLDHGEPIGEAVRGYSMAMADIDLMEELGLDLYRFSISWSRVEPQRDQISEEALAHYSAFIDELRARGIQPMITLHHFSNPVWIDDPRDVDCSNGPTDENLCGWNHPQGSQEVIAEFAEHATLIAQRFGDRVDLWCTLNEPINYMLAAYGVGEFPPGKQGIFQFEESFIPTVRNYISGHVAAYDAIKAHDTTDADGDDQPASVGLTKGAIVWMASRDNALSDNPEDLAGRDRVDYLYNRFFVNSIVEGGFDTNIDETLDEPQPSWEGKLDFLGVQYYFRTGVTAKAGLLPVVNVTPCFEGFDFGSCIAPADPTHYIPDMGYEYWEPGVYELLTDFSRRWPNLPMTITESGVAANNGTRRAEHIVRSLEQIWRAAEEGVDVRGYYHWSLTDNYEWAFGYAPHFGLYEVNYDTYERTATEGATVYSQILDARALTEELRATYGGLGPMSPETESEE